MRVLSRKIVLSDVCCEKFMLSRNKPSHLGSINFHQGCEDNIMGKELSFQQMVLGHLDMHMQKMKLDPYLTPYTKLIQNISTI